MLHVPYVGSVDRPINAGVIVKISGLSPINAQRFNVNLQCGPSINPRDDVAFHMSADFYNRCLISNNILDNGWGVQQRDSHFPFQKGEEFVIDVSCKQSSFEVVVNDHHSVSFEHRIDPSRITHLAIDGDVVLYKIEYIGGLHGAFSDPFIGGTLDPTIPLVTPVGFNVPPTPSQVSTYNSPFPLYSAPDPSRGHSQPNFHQSPYMVQEPYPTAYHSPTQYPGPNLPPTFPQSPAYSQQFSSYSAVPPHPRQDAVSGVAKKPSKFSQKAREKAMKLGLPIAAGTGLGVYAMKGWFKKCSKSSDDSD